MDVKATQNGMTWLPFAEAAQQLALSGLKRKDLGQMKSSAKGVSALIRLIAEGK